jgi:hypothetical protein
VCVRDPERGGGQAGLLGFEAYNNVPEMRAMMPKRPAWSYEVCDSPHATDIQTSPLPLPLGPTRHTRTPTCSLSQAQTVHVCVP